jgi:hydroxyacylglutathione hydrolase
MADRGYLLVNIIPIKLSVTTCYLIKKENQYILIDTGYEEDWDLFLMGLKNAEVEILQISHIILTHHHDDHCGLLHNILQENGSIRVVMSRLCKDLILKGKNDQTHGGGLLNRRVAFLIHRKQFYLSIILKKKVDKANNLKFRPYQIRNCDILVDEEPRLRDIGIPLDGRIIQTPGHTVDSISVLLDDGDCFIGDAAAHMLPFAGTKYCVIFICDMDEYYRSWEKVIAAGARQIFPAHGKPFDIEKLKSNIGKNKTVNLVHY